MNEEIKQLNNKAKQYAEDISKVTNEIKRVIVGQDEIIDKTLIALIANGHVLIEGVQGLAKSLIVKTLSDTLECGFVRLQFTPDLLPADITGTKIYNSSSSSFSVLKGPIFTNFVLADEINRAPPKVQSALLEAMQERQVSIQGETHKLKSPFLVLATQNPIESEGTYKLPEAQIDRFMFKLLIGYPKKEDEVEIIERFTEGKQVEVKNVLTSKQILEMQEFNHEIYADRKIKEYVSDIIDATRHPENYKLDIKQYIEYGASPRASIWLILASKANAMINGRGYVVPEDVKAVVHDILRHRILLTYEAESEDVTTDQIIDQIMSKIKVP